MRIKGILQCCGNFCTRCSCNVSNIIAEVRHHADANLFAVVYLSVEDKMLTFIIVGQRIDVVSQYRCQVGGCADVIHFCGTSAKKIGDTRA